MNILSSLIVRRPAQDILRPSRRIFPPLLRLYEWLVLADALRGAGRARERELAEQIVRKRLGYGAAR